MNISHACFFQGSWQRILIELWIMTRTWHCSHIHHARYSMRLQERDEFLERSRGMPNRQHDGRTLSLRYFCHPNARNFRIDSGHAHVGIFPRVRRLLAWVHWPRMNYACLVGLSLKKLISVRSAHFAFCVPSLSLTRSEERRVGKEC